MFDQKVVATSVVDKIFFISHDIVKLNENYRIDAIVNAAKSTLMGGSGVDGAIHKKIDELYGEDGYFNKMIKQELDKTSNEPDGITRCKPGNIRVTQGHKDLANYIIHAVAPHYDGGSECIHILKSCYQNIIEYINVNPEINNVAIPLIGSGNCGFPLDLAFRIAFVTIANELIELKNTNIERYDKIQKIYLVLYTEKKIRYAELVKIHKEYENILKKDKKAVMTSSLANQKLYLIEVWKYDRIKRNYFTTVKGIRLFLIICRYIFFPSLLLRYYAGKYGWHFRRGVIEAETMIKTITPILLTVMLQIMNEQWISTHKYFLAISCAVVIYSMADTLTCVMWLIFLADLQPPAANPLRNLVMLILNYIETMMSIALLYYSYLWGKITFWDALDYSILGRDSIEIKTTIALRVIDYTKTGVGFLFTVLFFGFFVAHLRQKNI